MDEPPTPPQSPRRTLGFASIVAVGLLAFAASASILALASGWTGSGHRGFAWAAVAIGVLAHAGSWVALDLMRRRAATVAAAESMPAWVEGLAMKNARKAWPFQVGGGLLLASAALPASGPGHAAVGGLAAGFGLGAFAIEGLLVAIQGRLVTGIEARAAQHRSRRCNVVGGGI